LDRSGRGLVRIIQPLGDLELRSKQRCNARRVITLDWQAAAFRWSIEAEGCDDRRPAGLERLAKVRHVRIALWTRDEKMEDGAIVPDVDWRRLPFGGHIGLNPPDVSGSRSESRARPCERG
jgi:hypothetical protein